MPKKLQSNFVASKISNTNVFSSNIDLKTASNTFYAKYLNNPTLSAKLSANKIDNTAVSLDLQHFNNYVSKILNYSNVLNCGLEASNAIDDNVEYSVDDFNPEKYTHLYDFTSIILSHLISNLDSSLTNKIASGSSGSQSNTLVRDGVGGGGGSISKINTIWSKYNENKPSVNNSFIVPIQVSVDILSNTSNYVDYITTRISDTIFKYVNDNYSGTATTIGLSLIPINMYYNPIQDGNIITFYAIFDLNILDSSAISSGKVINDTTLISNILSDIDTLTGFVPIVGQNM